MDYCELQYDRPSSQPQRPGMPYEIPEDAGSQETGDWCCGLDPFFAWFFLLGGLFMVAGFIYGVVLLIAMLIWL